MATTATAPRTRPAARPAPRFRLRRTPHRAVLTAHVLTSVGWFGIAVLVAYLALTAGFTGDPTLRRALYRTLEITPWLSVPAGLLAFATGGWLSVGTVWGFVRHWWVVAKMAIATAVILTDLLILLPASRTAVATGTAPGPLRDGAIAHCVALTVATVLSVFKPRARTPWGRRRLADGAPTTSG